MKKRIRVEKWPNERKIAKKVNQIWQKSKIRRKKIPNIRFEIWQDSAKKITKRY